jgi:mannose-6-phosphate isomerase
MSKLKLYPLKFEPLYQYRVWGGRRLGNLLKKPLPPDELIGEAWILSDREDHPSTVSEGPLKGRTIKELLADSARELLGDLSGQFKRFPLLLKFLDAQQVLSVQVHPSDDKKAYIPAGESGKTEAWVVLETGDKAIIYAGLKPGTTEEGLRDSLNKHKVADDLASFKPKTGDCVLIDAGTVHTLGDAVVFEVQENSDVTYRLYDWDRVDEKTGKPRDLQVEQAFACIDFDKTAIGPVVPLIRTQSPELKEQVFNNEHFKLWRHTCESAFMVGKENTPRVLVCIEGEGDLECCDDIYNLAKGDVMLLPAVVGACPFVPKGKTIILEIALPGSNTNR